MKRIFIALIFLIGFLTLIPKFSVQQSTYNFQWSPNIQFRLPAYGTKIAFADWIYFDSFAWDRWNATKITFYNLKMGNGSQVEKISFSVEKANLTVTKLLVNNQLECLASAPNGTTSTVRIETGRLGKPSQVTANGTINAVYNAETAVLTVYITHSSVVKLTVDWTATPSGGATGGGVSQVYFNVKPLTVKASRGRLTHANLEIEWVGTNTIKVTEFKVEEQYAEWIALNETLPLTYSKAPTDSHGSAILGLNINVPSDATVGSYSIAVTVKAIVAGVAIQKSGTIHLIVEKPSVVPVGVPQYMTYIFLVCVLGLAIYGFYKHK